MASKREKREERFAGSTRRLKDHKTQGGSRALKLPSGVNFFAPKKGEDALNLEFLCYRVSDVSKKFKENFAEPGELYYERTYFVHADVGVNQDKVICPAMTFGKKCPICEEKARLLQDPKVDRKKVIKPLNPKERQLWLVYDLDNKKKKVQVWDISLHLLGVNIEEKMQKARESKREAYQNFASPKNGLTVRLTGKEKSIEGGKPFTEWVVDEFTEREEKLPAEIIEKAKEINLDEIVRPMSYDALSRMFFQLSDEDELPNKKKKRGEDEDEDEDNDTDDSDEDEDEDEDEESDEDEKPAKKGKAKKSKKDQDGDDGDVDEDDSEDDSEEDQDEDDSDEDEDDSDSEDDDEAEEGLSVGDEAQWIYKGKLLKGKIKKINKKTGNAEIGKNPRTDKPYVVALDELGPVDDEPDEEEEDEKPAKKGGKKKPPAKKGKKKDEDEEEEEEEDEDGDEESDEDDEDSDSDDEESDEGTDDDDDDDDEEPLEDEEEEEEDEDEKPAKRGKKKPPAKRAPAKKKSR